MALTKITATNIGANAVTANSIGYAPANRAGDTFTGAITTPGVYSNGGINLTGTTFEAALRMTNSGAGGQDYYLFSTMNSFTQGGGKFMLYNGGNGHPYDWAVDSAGRMTVPYQPAFAATLTTNVASGAAAQVVALNNAITNVGSCFNTSTYRFTAPVAGSYQIQFKWESISGTAPLYSELQVRKNGSSIMYGIAKKDANSTEYTAMIGRVMYLNANDYLEVYYTAGGGILAGEQYTVFSGHLIG